MVGEPRALADRKARIVSGPTTVNEEAGKANEIIARANSIAVQLVISIATASEPWLGWPIIRTVFKYTLGWLDDYLSKAEQAGASFAIIDHQIADEKNGIAKAIAEVLAAQKSGDKNALKKAIQDYADAQSALVHYDGDAKPH